MSFVARFVRTITIPWLVLIVLAAPRAAEAELVWAVDVLNKLVVFGSSSPGTPLLEQAVSGMQAGETLMAIDFRPLDGQLYGYGSTHRLYHIHPWTAKATPISTAPLALTVAPGAHIGFDFNPVTDEIRIISSTNQNFRVNPSTGQVIDGDPGTPGIQGDSTLTPAGEYVAAAYSNNFHGAADTTLVALDVSQTAFVRIGGIGGNPSPNLGSVTEIGPIAAPFDVRAGLDVTSDNQVYASLDDSFYVINRTTGIAVEIGEIAAVTTVEDIAVLNVSMTMYLLTDDNRLLRIKSHSPSTTLTDVAISGLERAIDGEVIVAIDVRPANGRLYGLSNFARLYTLDPLTGLATKIGAANATITGLTGFSFGIDFDRVLDELRIVSDTQSNLRVDPDTLAVTQHTLLEEMGIGAIAYSYYDPNNQLPELFGIDSITDNLVLIGGIGGTPSADNGAVTTVRDIDTEVPPRAGLDMSPVDDTLYLAARISGDDGLYSIIRGVAHRVGDPIVNDGGPVIGLAIAAPGFVGFPIRGLAVNEQAGSITLGVTRTGQPDGPLAVEYEFGAGAGVPATQGVDYTGASGTLIFLDGETMKSIVVPIINDTAAESDETFQVSFSSPTLGAQLGTGDTFTVTILDNDTAPGNAPPTITITQPTPAATFTAQGVLMTLGGTASDDAGITTIAWSNDRGGSGTAQGTTNWLAPDIPLALGTNVITVTVTDTGGLQATDTVTVTLSTLSYVLAEGATGAFFDLDILLANPNATPAPVTVKFLKEGGSVVEQTLTLPATSRTTLRADTIAGLESTAVSTVVTSDAGLPLIVERTMRWDGSGYGAHTDKAAEAPAPKWYFAEGSQGFFSTYLLLVNPGTAGLDVIVQYLREGDTPVTRVYTLLAQSRLTVDAGADPELVDRSFGMTVEFQGLGVAERAMYFGVDPLWKAGHESAGVTTPATEWLLAEGATGSFFDTFLLLSNPGTTPADVTVTYLPASGATIVKTKTIPAQGRLTINVEFEDPALADAAFGTTLSSSVPIVVERAQYWPNTPAQWYEAHNSFGVLSTGTKWGIAEGRAGGANNYQTYILLANPGGTSADVTITFLKTDGTTLIKTFAVAAFSRFNVAVGAGGQVPELAGAEFGAVISSTQPIVVERAMYADAGGLVWSAGTNATATRLP